MDNLVISDLIPQAEPFVMVDRILSIQEGEITTELVILPDNVLCENNYLQEAGLIEMMAQTAACLTGYRSKVSNTEIVTGYIGMVKNLEILRLPECNTKIISTVQEEKQIMNIVIIKGRIKQGDEMIAQAEYRIYLDS